MFNKRDCVFGISLFILILSIFLISASVLDNSPSQSVLNLTNILNLGNTWKEIIIGLIFSVVLFAFLFDLFGFFSVGKTLNIVLSVGLAIAFAYFSWTNKIVLFILSFAVAFGTLGVIGLVILSIIIFIGLSSASLPIAKFAAKMKARSYSRRRY